MLFVTQRHLTANSGRHRRCWREGRRAGTSGRRKRRRRRRRRGRPTLLFSQHTQHWLEAACKPDFVSSSCFLEAPGTNLRSSAKGKGKHHGHHKERERERERERDRGER